MPPSKDWMVIISDSMGHKKGLMLTQLYTPITEMLFMILEEEIIEGYPTWIAVPDDLVISPSRLSFLQALDVRLIPCKFPNWDAEPPIRAEMWNKPKE
ncbi:MAG: hypothetical protein QF440_05730 [Candidatus Thalassarchaeaceae archaeon]|nr:hypothetical protein [Candidatus Thalassarchaeaceae archaeon]